MSEWTVLEGDSHVRDNSDGWSGWCSSELNARKIRDRHNREIAAIEEDNDVYRELNERLAADNVKLREKVNELQQRLDKLEPMEQDIADIQKLIGCKHPEPTAPCVKRTIEDLQSRLAAVRIAEANL